MSKERRQLITRVVVFTAVIAVSLFIFTLPEDTIENLSAYGYPGVFLISLTTSSTVLLPVPGLVTVFSLGARFHPLWIALAAGAGATLGELTGYLLGFSGNPVIDDLEAYKRMVTWMERYGPLAVLVLGSFPNPLFDLTGIAAGALRMPVLQFLFWAWIGITIKMLLVAYAGAGLFPWLNGLLTP